ncbi:MAG: hypothetical protein ACLFNU_07755 [Bacteroidales bacterium]
MFEDISILEWIGYLASVIIALSMAMSSIVKFRVINLIGAALFSTYGFLIGSLPVGILNGFIVAVDIYYLISIFSKKEVFETLEIRNDNRYLLRFLSFHDSEIQKYFPGFTYKPEVNTVSFFILRNMSVAGVFLAHRHEENILKVGLDFVIPEYRDFKNGRFVYNNLRNKFIEAGFTKVVASKSSKHHEKYLKKLGFVENERGMLEKELV